MLSQRAQFLHLLPHIRAINPRFPPAFVLSVAPIMIPFLELRNVAARLLSSCHCNARYPASGPLRCASSSPGRDAQYPAPHWSVPSGGFSL